MHRPSYTDGKCKKPLRVNQLNIIRSLTPWLSSWRAMRRSTSPLRKNLPAAEDFDVSIEHNAVLPVVSEGCEHV